MCAFFPAIWVRIVLYFINFYLKSAFSFSLSLSISPASHRFGAACNAASWYISVHLLFLLSFSLAFFLVFFFYTIYTSVYYMRFNVHLRFIGTSGNESGELSHASSTSTLGNISVRDASILSFPTHNQTPSATGTTQTITSATLIDLQDSPAVPTATSIPTMST